MMEFLTNVVPYITPVLVIIGTIYLGWNQTLAKKKDVADHLEDEASTSLKTLVDTLEKRLGITEKDLQAAREEIARLSGENDAYRKTASEKTALTNEFYTKSLQNMKITEETIVKFDNFIGEWKVQAAMLSAFVGGATEFRNNVEKLTIERRRPKTTKRLVKSR